MPINILLVSDSISDRQNFSATLNEYNILTAADEAEALQVLAEHKRIYLMILDIDMPGFNWVGLMETLRNAKAHENLRAIIMSERQDPENEILGVKLGVVEYFKKPVNMEILKAKMDTRAEIFKSQEILQKKYRDTAIIFETIYKQMPAGVSIYISVYSNLAGIDAQYNFNPAYEKILGRSEAELRDLGWKELTYPDDLQEDLDQLEKLKKGEIESYSLEKRIIMPDGSLKWVYITVAGLYLSEDRGFNYITLISDIDEEKKIITELGESERSKSVLLSNLHGMAYRCTYDRDWTMEFVSSACKELCGCHPNSLINNKDFSYNDLIAPEYRDQLWQDWGKALANKTQFQSEYEIIDAKGKRKWVLELGEGVFNSDGEVEALEGIITDISDRKNVEDKIRYLSEHDEWTGLFNLNYLEAILIKDIKTGAIKNSALINVNLNPIYALSLQYGNQYVQQLIKKVSGALEELASEQRMLFSSASFRFLFYVRPYDDENELVKFCNQISDLLKSLRDVERIGFGIGVIEIEEMNEDDMEETFKNLLIASEEGLSSNYDESNIYFCDDELDERSCRRNVIRQELASVVEGIDRDRLFLQFQPVIDLNDDRISEFEALARFNSNELGLVPPSEFIPIAEETKDIVPLGNIIIRKAGEFLKKLQADGHDIGISINISPIQILSEGFVNNTLEILSKMDINPEHILFELTESKFSSDFDRINAVIGQLNAHGIKHAIDDFGIAYSSLSRLQELYVNYIKIDRSFISKLSNISEDLAITNDIISMSHKMGLLVVAEGVEDQKQMNYLRSHDCDKIQGYLLSRPLDEDMAIEFLKSWDK